MVTTNPNVALAPRPVPLVPKRVASVFAEKEQPQQDDKYNLQFGPLDKEKKVTTASCPDIDVAGADIPMSQFYTLL